MRSSHRRLFVLLIAALVIALLLLAQLVPALTLQPSLAQTSACGLPGAVFCDTFDAPAGIGNRSGDLNGTIWGVSHATGDVNIGQGRINAWAPTDLDACGTTLHVQPPHDLVICNGTLREATNDNHGVTALAMYPKQPFDFAGRTGKVVFDVSNDTLNTHDAWPEFWVSDKPDPTPFNHFDSWQSLPKDGFGVRMGAGAPPNNIGYCQNTNNMDKLRWTVDSAVVVRNYAIDDTNGYGQRQVQLKQLDCVVSPNGPNGGLNHVEMDISQNQIDVYATDAGTTAPLHHIAQITNANLSLTRGLVWFEDAHYNATKAITDSAGNEVGPHRVHTFTWDNIAFDGPLTYHDLSFDAPDNTAVNASDGSINLGQFAQLNQASTWKVPGLPANPVAAAVRVLFNVYITSVPTTLNVTVNGHAHSMAYPYPDPLTYTWRTLDLQIPVTDLVPGTNVVTIGAAGQQLITSNVNIVLVDAGAAAPAPAATTAATKVPSTATPVQPTAAPPTATPVGAQPSACRIQSSPAANLAFCEDLSGGASPGGRAGDLDDTKWSVGRFDGAFGLTDLMPFPQAPATACKAGITAVNSDNDILVCDAPSGHAGQFETALAAQYYALISMRPRQVFDFTNRTGTITYNVDAATESPLGWWTSMFVTQDPVPGANNTERVSGMTPRNGVGVSFDGNNCSGTLGTSVRINTVYTYNDYAETAVPVNNGVCIQTQAGKQNHIEIRLSQSMIEVWASDFSTDGSQSFPNFRMIGSVPISLNFSQGYVHFQHGQRAPTKYAASDGFTALTSNYYWSNLGFDGPVVGKEVAYQVPDSLTHDTNNRIEFPNQTNNLNIGYGLLTNPNQTYVCCAQQIIGAMPLPNVNKTGVGSATLTFSVLYVSNGTTNNSSTYALKYRLNGGAWQSPMPAPEFSKALMCQAWGGNTDCNWSMGFAIPVALSNLVQGNNTVEIASDGSSNSNPPVLANVELITTGGAAAPVPTPTSPPPATSTPVPVPSSTPVPASTATPVPTQVVCQVMAFVNGQQQLFSRPASFCTDQ